MTHTQNIIRIRDSEYDAIDASTGYFGHFNLGKALHQVGVTYELPRILKPGSNINGVEIPPTLSYENIYEGECIAAEDGIPCENVDPDKFKYSMRHIKNIDELKDIIWKRYSVSRPSLSSDEMMAMGVSFTLLKIKRKA